MNTYTPIYPLSPAEIPQSWTPCRRPTLGGFCGDDLSDPETGFYSVATCEKCDEEIALLQSLDREAEAMEYKAMDMELDFDGGDY